MSILITRLVSRRVRELETALALERAGRKAADQRAAILHDTGRILAGLPMRARTENRLLRAAAQREVTVR